MVAEEKVSTLLFYLISLNLVRFLTEDASKLKEDESHQCCECLETF